MLQFANHCEITLLDPYFPSDEEKQDAKLFANNVRSVMAEELGVGTTEHSYDDVWFAADATKSNINQDFEIGRIKELYNMDLEGLKVLLKRFKQFDLDDSGTLSKAEFEQALEFSGDRSEDSSEHFFAFFDTTVTSSASLAETEAAARFLRVDPRAPRA